MAGGSEDFPTDRPSESSLLRKSCFRKTPEPLQKTKIGQKEREREREGRGKNCSKKKIPNPSLESDVDAGCRSPGMVRQREHGAPGRGSRNEPPLPSAAPWDLLIPAGSCSFWESIWG